MQTCVLGGGFEKRVATLQHGKEERKGDELLDSIAEALQEGDTRKCEQKKIKWKPRTPKSKGIRRQAVQMELSEWDQPLPLEDNPEQLW